MLFDMISEIFPWNSNFETGQPVIDEQHKKLVEIINKLGHQLTHDFNEVEVLQVVDELVDYTVYHFTTEEAIWREGLSSDQMVLEHEKTHQDFVDEISKVRQSCKSLHDKEVREEMLSFLTRWLAFHILNTDRKMVKIVHAVEQGLDLQGAKEQADNEMDGATTALIETVLTMYDTLSSQALELMQEVSRRKASEQKLLLSKSVIDNSFEAIFVTDTEGVVIDANPSFCSFVNITQDQLVGKQLMKIKPELFAQQAISQIMESAGREGHCSGEISSVNVEGRREAAWLTVSIIRDYRGNIVSYAGVLSSVSQLLERQHSLEQEVNHDNLTGLPNRRLLGDRLEQAIHHGKRHKKILAVCFLDLDGFKAVNDTLGHEAGDELLCVVSERLKSILRGEDTVARIGGDEFVLLLGDLESEQVLPEMLNKVLTCIQTPIPIHGDQAHVSASIGVSFCPEHSEDREALLKSADKAMYQAKHAGKSRFCIYGA